MEAFTMKFQVKYPTTVSEGCQKKNFQHEFLEKLQIKVVEELLKKYLTTFLKGSLEDFLKKSLGEPPNPRETPRNKFWSII